MLPVFPAHLFARLVVITHDVGRDVILRNVQKYSEVARSLQEAEQHCVVAGLTRTAKQVRIVLDACKDGRCPPVKFQVLVKPIPALLIEELAEFAFLTIPRERVGFFKDVTRNGPPVPGAEDVLRDFHTARRCLGLGEPTACVLHLVRVIEFGAKVIAKSLGIKTEGQTIGWIAAAIQDSIKHLARAGGCTPEIEEFYNALVTDIRAFARAYRNPAVHKFQNFTDQKANAMITIVGDFMEHLVNSFGDLENPTTPTLALAPKAP